MTESTERMLLNHYLLVPDTGAARRLRRLLCADTARTGVVVGTWGELLVHACADYLVPMAETEWDAELAAALHAFPHASWSKSLEVAPAETTSAVWVAARQLLLATRPGEMLEITADAALTERAQRNVRELTELITQLDGKLPPDMEALRALIDCPSEFAIRSTCVYSIADKPRLDAWQTLLIEKLNDDAGSEHRGSLQALLESVVSPQPTSGPHTQLGNMQSALYTTAEKRDSDSSAQWVGVRDARQEVEVAAGMVQKLIATGVDPRDIGLLLPTDEQYYEAVHQSFDHAGLPVSGLPQPDVQRDLGYEVIFNFLVCMQRPAPAMALAAFLVSPLMPWQRSMGNRLAHRIMDGDFSLSSPGNAGTATRMMLELLRIRNDSSEELSATLSELGNLLPKDDDQDVHQARAQAAISLLHKRLSDTHKLDWRSLRSLVSPVTLSIADATEYTLEGVTVWLEDQTPWRPVQHLLVLGFRDRHYPCLPGYSPVFFPEDLRAINAACCIELDTNEALLKRRRSLFKSQLSLVSESVTFLIPRRDAFGKFVAPASSLLFMAGLRADIEKPEDLVLDIESTSARGQIRHLAIAAPTTATPPRSLQTDHLALNRNLLELRTDEDGQAAPQSPSRLENLIVSPFAWLLGQLHAEPNKWLPDQLSVMLKGSIAHDVFELLFPKEQPITSSDEIQQTLPDIYAGVLNRRAPFMRAPAWHVERRHLRKEIFEAALTWRDILGSLDATVVDVEFWLAGRFDAQPIHGQVDALIALPENRLLVIDFKKSSESSRRARMEKGYDIQASLYRHMLETGGPKNDAGGEIITRLQAAESIGVGYFTMNDGRLLADSLVPGAEQLPGWVSFDNPVSANAMDILRQRFGEVTRGEVLLNNVDDEKTFERTMGIKPYALDNSPLVRLFMRPEGSGGAA